MSFARQFFQPCNDLGDILGLQLPGDIRKRYISRAFVRSRACPFGDQEIFTRRLVINQDAG